MRECYLLPNMKEWMNIVFEKWIIIRYTYSEIRPIDAPGFFSVDTWQPPNMENVHSLMGAMMSEQHQNSKSA